MNENYAPINEDAILVFPDIDEMYPNIDKDEALNTVKEKHDNNPNEFGLPTDSVAEGLAICNDCNCVQFNGKY